MLQSQHHTAFWSSYGIALLLALLIFAAVFWFSGLGGPNYFAGSLTATERTIRALVVSIIFLPIPLLGFLGVHAKARQELPVWTKILLGFYVIMFAVFGCYSLIFDLGDFVWSGLPILICCMALGNSLRQYPKETT